MSRQRSRITTAASPRPLPQERGVSALISNPVIAICAAEPTVSSGVRRALLPVELAGSRRAEFVTSRRVGPSDGEARCPTRGGGPLAIRAGASGRGQAIQVSGEGNC